MIKRRSSEGPPWWNVDFASRLMSQLERLGFHSFDFASARLISKRGKAVISVMKGFVQNIEALATKNANFRCVLYIAKNCQLVVMSLPPAEEIGMEVHKLDQFFRVEGGSGRLSSTASAVRSAPASLCSFLPAPSTTSSIRVRPHSSFIRSMLRQTTVTASFIARVRMPRRTTSISTVRRRNRRSLQHVRCSTCR